MVLHNYYSIYFHWWDLNTLVLSYLIVCSGVNTALVLILQRPQNLKLVQTSREYVKQMFSIWFPTICNHRCRLEFHSGGRIISCSIRVPVRAWIVGSSFTNSSCRIIIWTKLTVRLSIANTNKQSHAIMCLYMHLTLLYCFYTMIQSSSLSVGSIEQIK